MRSSGLRARLLGILLGLPALALVAGSARGPDPVYPSATAVQPLTIGASVPSVEVVSVGGETVDLASLVAERGALLVFYRGGW